MRKIIALISIIIAVSNFNLYSQNLSNTTWAVYDTTNSFFFFFHFHEHIFSCSWDNTSYTDLSSYQENGNNFTIVDLPGYYYTNCHIADTGRYSFSIQNDTLKFTLISDPCDSRIITISTYHWIKTDNPKLLSMMKIYPNPTKGKICIESEIIERIEVFDITGKLVYELAVSSDVLYIDLSAFRNGVYFLRIMTEQGVVVERIVLE